MSQRYIPFPLLTALVLCVALAACSKREPPPSAAPAPAPAAAESANKGPADAAFAAKICEALKKTLGGVDERTQPTQVTATFATQLVQLFADKTSELGLNFQQLDAAATAACPADRERLLARGQQKSLADAILNPADPMKAAGAPPQK